jgi:hypothetical protein
MYLIDYTAVRPSTLPDRRRKTEVKMVNPKMRQMIVKASPSPSLSSGSIFPQQAKLILDLMMCK